MGRNNPAAVGKELAVKALRAAGSRTASLEALERDIAAGAPVNADGTVNLLAYAAWLLKGEDDGNRL